MRRLLLLVRPQNRCILPHILKGAKVADIMSILGSIDVGSEQVA